MRKPIDEVTCVITLHIHYFLLQTWPTAFHHKYLNQRTNQLASKFNTQNTQVLRLCRLKLVFQTHTKIRNLHNPARIKKQQQHKPELKVPLSKDIHLKCLLRKYLSETFWSNSPRTRRWEGCGCATTQTHRNRTCG